MKKWICLSATILMSASALAAESPNIGVVDVKLCVEESKLGKQEQANFEALKKQMEAVLLQKDKELADLAGKLNDPDYLDSVSPEAETEMKRKFRALSQEMNQLQTQYYQTLNQANFKVMQTIGEGVTKAADKLSQSGQYDFIINDEVCFYVNAKHNISKAIIEQMDRDFDAQAKQDAAEAQKSLLK